MSRSLSYLRRGLLGAAVAGALGFGATQALATPAQTSARTVCSPEMEAYCAQLCGEAGGYCQRPTTPGGPFCFCY